MAIDELLQAKFAMLKALLDERLRCIWAGMEARSIGPAGSPESPMQRACHAPWCAPGSGRSKRGPPPLQVDTCRAATCAERGRVQGSERPAARLAGSLGALLGTGDARESDEPSALLVGTRRI